MKKIIKIIVPLVLIFVCVTGAFAQGTLSEEILNQAKREAGLFLELKSALGLDWLDEYNAYLENPTSNPEPSWDLSVADLVNGGYLSDSFPSDFTITKAGQEVKISKIITSQAMKDVLPIYLPSVTIAGDVVSLIVQRPEQWVAWQAGLLGKVSRDGSDNPDILPNAVLDFGKGSEIRFINDDGKLVGIDSLEYKDQELDDRFVNVTGDTMSGSLTAPEYRISDVNTRIYKGEANSVRIQTNFGRVDIGPQDVNYAHFSTDRSKFLFDEPVHVEGRIQIYGADTYLIATEGKIDGHKILTTADEGHGKGLDADTLDGDHASSFSRVGHGHNYVSREGDTMEGTLNLPNLEVQSGGSVKFYSESGASTISADQLGNLNLQANKVTVPSKMDVGGLKITDIYAQDVFGWKSSVDLSGSNVGIRVPDQNILLGFNDKGGITVVDTTNGAPLFELDRKGQLYVNRNKIWHVGNDGSGSGLDADLIDGLDSSAFLRNIDIPSNSDLNNYRSGGLYNCIWHPTADTVKNTPCRGGFYLLVLGNGDDCTQVFFPYMFAFSGGKRFFIRGYAKWENIWTKWQYVNIDGEVSSTPGNIVYVDLSNNPIDVSHLLQGHYQTSYNEITDETGTYKMWKYSDVFSNNDIVSYIKTNYGNQIKNAANLSTLNAIYVQAVVTPQVVGNILAAGGIYTKESPSAAIRDRWFGTDIYNSIATAKDIVGKTQNIVKSLAFVGSLQQVDVYTMKSVYQYNNVYLEAKSTAKLLVVGANGVPR